MKKTTVHSAKLSWNEDGTPISEQFDDVYFSNQDGLEESRYVFLAGNQFPERFKTHPRHDCVIAETGFGTGLNFITLWQSFKQFRQQNPTAALRQLHFISLEKYPLQVEDLRAAHQRWPELKPFTEQLCQQWPLPLPGNHRIELDNGAVILDLWFGDINTLLPALDFTLFNHIDAWFLDGFAPSKDAAMWSEQLFTSMARSMRENGTFATFTSAGMVRRGLQSAGFTLKKIKGYGRKREMLTGYLSAVEKKAPRPWYCRKPASCSSMNNKPDIAIIGGGIASLTTAEALMRRGAQVTLYCQDNNVALNGSGNRQGALYPLLNGADDPLERFFIAAFPYARRFYQRLNQQGVSFSHQWCGVTQLAYDEKTLKKITAIQQIEWPTDFAQPLTRQQLQSICGLDVGHDGIHYALGGWLSPAELCQNLLAHLQQQGLVVHFNHRVVKLSLDDENWQLGIDTPAGHQQRNHSVVVIANGHALIQFAQTERLPVTATRGQVSHIPSTPRLQQLDSVLCYDGYLTPVDPHYQQHCLGASYQREGIDTDYHEEEQQQNKQRLLDCLPEVDWTKDIDISEKKSRQGIRGVIRDHLPLVGNVPHFEQLITQYATLAQQIKQQQPIAEAAIWPNLFVNGALGSRGLCSAPLCAEIIAAQIFAEPLPLDDETLADLNPNRFWIKKLLRGRTVTTKLLWQEPN
ncbi:bifunctional tRNA (5-methylaminomethyl-2-thiouridine)(34)-methyltransferase MnmD/FAD-dependent 5-carboxymethylaminomethyl-2-thiouridine(34) oxidoreductase MnmC [Moellerella wisconsensis]|uniref:bifunctional tRNA (5-methylaminomethyl-2-thiouridine)(34)-methyltransferase MnmD/FAD-dependent 5-carboxymethylaminomethyl-2-thiouridine(34) oxidoreductase MnmC n=1 Tax=Moellerella wisconsensis TaxID=158849 RepID=UPI0030763F78